MTAAVKLSPKSARALLAALNPQFVGNDVGRALDEIRRQLEPKPKQTRKRKARLAKPLRRRAREST